MKHYKTPAGDVWAYEPDGSQDHLIKPDMVAMTAAEVHNHRFPPPDPRAQALQELRAFEAQITPLALAEAIVSGDMTDLRGLVQKIKAAREKIK